MVVILHCSEEENIRRLTGRSPGSKSKLMDVDILREIRQKHFVYSFYSDGLKVPAHWKYELDIENLEPEKAAGTILGLLKLDVCTEDSVQKT